MFAKKGLITLLKEEADEERLMEVALEAGAEDIKDEDDIYEVVTQSADLETVREALVSAGLTPESAELARIPATTVSLDEKQASSLIKLLDGLEECDDVQNVWSNGDLPEGLEED
jgi:transcriptional/translational regulatory protein YebC/TACO1